MLLDVETRVGFLERCKESVRFRDTPENTISEWIGRATSRSSRHGRLSARALSFALELVYLSTMVAMFMPLMGLVSFFWLWSIRPFNPRGEGFGFIEWPNKERTLFRKRPRPQPSKAFAFLQEWLADPVHVKMVAYMTSSTGLNSYVNCLAEEAILWQLSSDAWKHEKNSLSTESEELERQAIEKPNLNTLKQLVQCRRTTRKLQDSIEILHQQMPPITLDWDCAMKSWNQGWHESPERKSHRPFRDDFPPFVSNVQENPLESYWKERSDQTLGAEQTAELSLKDIEDSLTRSMSLLQEAIAVQTSDRALWLALIATFYFPATLATGIFGMNLSLIDGKPYWWAIVVCAILFVPNLAFLIYVFGRR